MENEILTEQEIQILLKKIADAPYVEDKEIDLGTEIPFLKQILSAIYMWESSKEGRNICVADDVVITNKGDWNIDINKIIEECDNSEPSYENSKVKTICTINTHLNKYVHITMFAIYTRRFVEFKVRANDYNEIIVPIVKCQFKQKEPNMKILNTLYPLIVKHTFMPYNKCNLHIIQKYNFIRKNSLFN